MTVRVSISIDHDIEGGSPETRQGVEIGMARLREGLEAIIAEKFSREFPAAVVEFTDQEESE